jgi:formylglycine-generating enzyme required for sulfatase activity
LKTLKVGHDLSVRLTWRRLKKNETRMMIQQNPKDDAELVWVPGGAFIMGSDPGEIGDLWQRNQWDDYWLEKDGCVRSELSPHEVEVAGFWMYRDLVTIAQYFRFMQETGYPAPVDQVVHTHTSWRTWLNGGGHGHDGPYLPRG